MAIDNDLSALLPDPPSPKPARREAAIEEALRRFDGEPRPALPPPARERQAPARGGWGRSQIAALASVALAVLVSVPVWWAERDRIVPGVPPPSAQDPQAPAPAPPAPSPQTATAARPEPAQSEPVASVPLAPRAPTPVTAGPAPASATLADARSPAEARERAPDRQVAAASQVAAAPRPAAARREASEDAITVTGSRIQRQDYDSTTPMVTADEALLEQGSSREQGDRDACTLLDPRRDVDACRSFADPAARGAAGRAGARLADGLTLAWQGDLDGAIDAFDSAISAEPDLSIAYLNRGLAYQAKGDLRRALADLNRAVARDRTGARGYYHRSLLHRARGDSARAEADARRAVELDPQYRAVLP